MSHLLHPASPSAMLFVPARGQRRAPYRTPPGTSGDGRSPYCGGAAGRLGITKEAVRKRIHRGTLHADKDADATVRVHGPPCGMASGTASPESRDVLVAEMRARITGLKEQLDQERTASAEVRRILGALIQRIPELEAPAEPPGGPQNSEAGSEREGGTPRGGERALSLPEPRSWWKRVFGG
jgi:hypothetical protein